ncbi:MAG: radical SAM protein, partial [Candidatus Aenigmatarchaeota archaeon]
MFLHTNLSEVNLSCADGDCEVIPHLEVVKKFGAHVLLYSPLSAVLVIMANEYFEKIKNGKYHANELKNRLLHAKVLVEKGFSPSSVIIPQDSIHATFFIATRCNMNCVYCYADSGQQRKKITISAFKKIIDQLAAVSEKRKVNIIFHGGGEPTLDLDSIKTITIYARKKLNSPNLNLQSNGTYSRAVGNWLLKNIDGIVFSCDGPPEIQDAQRPLLSGQRSSDTVEGSIKNAVRRRKTISVTAS